MNKFNELFSDKIIGKLVRKVILCKKGIEVELFGKFKVIFFWSKNNQFLWKNNISFIINHDIFSNPNQRKILEMFLSTFYSLFNTPILKKEYIEYVKYLKKYNDDEIEYYPYFIYEYSDFRGNNYEFFINFPFCNNKCYFCHTHSIHTIKRLGFNKESIIEEFEKVSKNKKVSLIDFYGGEPTIHKDFFDLAKYFSEKNLYLSLATNGRYLKDLEFTKKIAKIFDSIRISFHDNDNKLFDNLTCIDGSFEETVQCIRNLGLIGYNYLTINIVITKENVDRLFEIVKFILSLGNNFTIKLSGLVFDTSESYKKINKVYPRLSKIKEKIEEVVMYLKKENVKYRIEKVPFCLLKISKDNYQSEGFNNINSNRVIDDLCKQCHEVNFCTLFSKYQYDFINKREGKYFEKIRNNYNEIIG